MNRTDQTEPITGFLVGTFSLSIVAGLFAFYVGGDETFESVEALPLLLVTIWSPNIVASVTRYRQGRLEELVRPVLFAGSPAAWAISLLPIAVACAVWFAMGSPTPQPIAPGMLGMLLVMNLFMGPLGEELGWRGFLLPALLDRFGWTTSTAMVGVVWATWHLPLWFLPSPQSQIHFGVFAATVLAFSFLMTAAWRAGDRALGPVIVFHLATNVSVGWLELSQIATASVVYEIALPIYGLLALVIWVLAGNSSGQTAQINSTA